MKLYPKIDIPVSIEDDKHMDTHISRLHTWAEGQCVSNMGKQLAKHCTYLEWYRKTNFKGRFKAGITIYHEYAKAYLIKKIYDKGTGKR